MAMHQPMRLSHQSFELCWYVQVALTLARRAVAHTSPSCLHWCDFNPGRMPRMSWVACRGISVGRGENACAHSPSCRHWCNRKHRSWPILEGHLGRGDPGWLYLPAVPPQLHLCENLRAYGGPSGPRGSRAAVPASCSWTSNVYEHFELAVIARDEMGQKLYHKGTLLYSFVCKWYVLDTIHVTHATNLVILYSTGSSRVRKWNDASTGNLHKHIAYCQPSSKESQIMEKFAGGCTYSHEGLRWRLLHWVVCKNRLYTIVDDEELRKVFAMLHAKVKIPCANTLAGDIKHAHGMMKEKLVELSRYICPLLHFLLMRRSVL